MNTKIVFVIGFCLVFVGEVNCQSKTTNFEKENEKSVLIDSLKNKLLSSSGTKKIDILIALSNEKWEVHPEKALDFANNALTLSKTLNYKQGHAKALEALGASNYTLSNYSIALEHYTDALVIAIELNDNDIIASIYNHIGLVYWKMKIPEKAIEYFEKFADYSRKLMDKKQIASSLNNLGLIYTDQGDSKVALKYFEDALKLSREINDVFAMGSSLTNMGMVYSKIKEHEKAIILFFEALEITDEKDNKWMDAIIYNNIGYTYQSMKNLDSAIYFARLGLEYSLDLGINKQISQSYEILSRVYKSQNRFEQALNAYEEYVAYKDSVYIEDNLSFINKLEEVSESNELREYKIEQENIRLQGESEERNRQHLIYLLIGVVLYISGHLFIIIRSNKKKNKLNALLAERNKQLQELNNRLQESEKELVETNITKDTLFSIIGHDLRSPFNSLIGFSDLLFDEYEELDDETKKRYISEINIAATKTFQLLENLLQWSRLQSGKAVIKPEKVNVYDLVANANSLVAISAIHKSIELINMVEKDMAIVADSNMVYTVFRNLLANAVKFTSENGYIYIAASEENDFYRFSVKDTGIGISDEEKTEIFRRVSATVAGTSGESGTGLGLEICREFITKHGGEIWVESKLGKGSTFFFTIPKILASFHPSF